MNNPRGGGCGHRILPLPWNDTPYSAVERSPRLIEERISAAFRQVAELDAERLLEHGGEAAGFRSRDRRRHG
jgi:hypothetical protein